MVRRVRGTQDVTALRGGGSLPAIMREDGHELDGLRGCRAGRGRLGGGAALVGAGGGDRADARTGSVGVWFDAFVANVDRTARNANLLCWHREVYFIDHGAALYFHHDFQSMEGKAESAFAQVKEHILLPWAGALEEADSIARERLNAEVFAGILEAVPEAWMLPEAKDLSAGEKRDIYADFFMRRLSASSKFVEEAIRARAELV